MRCFCWVWWVVWDIHVSWYWHVRTLNTGCCEWQDPCKYPVIINQLSLSITLGIPFFFLAASHVKLLLGSVCLFSWGKSCESNWLEKKVWKVAGVNWCTKQGILPGDFFQAWPAFLEMFLHTPAKKEKARIKHHGRNIVYSSATTHLILSEQEIKLSLLDIHWQSTNEKGPYLQQWLRWYVVGRIIMME